ncbi:MAG TPA: FUSC family protein [Trebonia sp.]|nr:FUSC family protein [Trebonia sp.]
MDSCSLTMVSAFLNRIRPVRPSIAYISRLTATSTFAYLLALVIPADTNRPVLAPLTALLVLQASLYQTIRSAIRKVLSVTAGVLMAVGMAEFIGFSWWQLGLVIGGALVIGRVLRLGDDLLEVPISAMLIFSSVGTHAAATGRVVDTLVGAAAGLAGGLVFAGGPRVQPASSAVGRLAGRVSGLMDQMADDLAREPLGDGNGEDDLAALARQWLSQARTLREEIERVDDTLREAADSARLNLRKLVAPAETAQATEATVALRGGLEALEHAALTLRGLTRSVLDSAGIATEASPVRDTCTRKRLASVLATLGAAIRTYGRLVQAAPSGDETLEAKLAAEFDEAHQLQDELADLLRPRAGDGGEPSEWPLRGEILTHVDRLRTGLSVEAVDALARVQRSSAHKQRRPRSRPRSRTGPCPATRPARLRPPAQLLRGSSRADNSAHSAR